MRFFRSPLFPIFMIVFVDMLGVGITLPVLPLYAQREFTATPTQITLMASLYFLAQFFATPRLGRLSDRVGRRPVLILSQAGTLLALLLSGSAPALWVLYAARLIDGITGGNISVAQAYLSDITDERNRARGLGLISAAFSLGFIFGPAFASLVAAELGPRVPFFIAAGVSLVTVLLSWRLLPESLPPEKRLAHPARGTAGIEAAARQKQILRIPGVLLLFAIGCLSQLAFFSFQATWVLWIERVIFPARDPNYVQRAVGLLLTLVGVCGIITQAWLVGPLVRRFGERVLVAAGTAMRVVSWSIILAFPVLWATIVMIPPLAMGGGIAVPALMALLTYTVPPEQKGYAIGLMESMQGLGRIAGPLLGGWLFQYVAPDAPNVLAVAVSALALAAALGLWQVQRAAKERVEA
jgi:MFS transporter, DHA1 family, tetracycline resistance protein